MVQEEQKESFGTKKTKETSQILFSGAPVTLKIVRKLYLFSTRGRGKIQSWHYKTIQKIFYHLYLIKYIFGVFHKKIYHRHHQKQRVSLTTNVHI